MRARLVGHLVGCYEATAAELEPDEAALWDVFVSADVGLRGSLKVPSDGISKVLQELPIAEERKPAFADELRARACEGELDFVDILDLLMEVRAECSRHWTFRDSIQSNLVGGLSQLLGSANAPPQGPSRRRTVADLRIRCARLQSSRLAAAAAAYQRSMVLTGSWTCERALKSFLASAHETQGGSSSSDAVNPSRGLVKPLLEVLRGIHAELTPTERVLWELLGASDSNFDGQLEQEEFTAAMEDLVRYASENEVASPADREAELELQRLRVDYQRQSFVAFFESLPPDSGGASGATSGGGGRARTVTLADVLRWWWDMPEELRTSVGFVVPSSLVRKSIARQPEEMFRKQLRRASADPVAARAALHGHVRVFAELRTLAVRRSVEALHSRTPTETQVSTTTVSELDDDEEDPDGECLISDAAPNAGAETGAGDGGDTAAGSREAPAMFTRDGA